MHQKQIAHINSIYFRKPLEIVKRELEKMNIVPETDIRIFPEYPFGWYSTVGANNRVYIFTFRRGRITLEIQPVWGFRPNGNLILKRR